MNLTELKYLVEIADTGSINKAAKRLYVAQPNMSKAVKAVEIEYGIQIFERTASGVVMTEDGKKFITQARIILQESEKLVQNCLNTNSKNVQLKLSIPRASYASEAFVNYVRIFAQEEKIRIHIKECNSLEAIDSITKHNYHMALIRYEVDSEEEYYKSVLRLKNLEYEEIMTFQYKILMSKNSKLAERNICEMKDLSDGIELIHGDCCIPDHSSFTYKKENSENKKRRIHVYDRGSQFALLRGVDYTYMWVSPMPEQVLNEHQLVQKDYKGKEHLMRDVLVYPSKSKLRKNEYTLIEQLKKEVKEVQK